MATRIFMAGHFEAALTENVRAEIEEEHRHVLTLWSSRIRNEVARTVSDPPSAPSRVRRDGGTEHALGRPGHNPPPSGPTHPAATEGGGAGSLGAYSWVMNQRLPRRKEKMSEQSPASSRHPMSRLFAVKPHVSAPAPAAGATVVVLALITRPTAMAMRRPVRLMSRTMDLAPSRFAQGRAIATARSGSTSPAHPPLTLSACDAAKTTDLPRGARRAGGTGARGSHG